MAMTTWIKGVLDGHGIAYEERHHRVAFSAQEVAHGEHVSGHRRAKVVAILADGRPVELVLPARRRVALGRVKQVLGTGEVRLASEAEMERIFTDCETGAILPLRRWQNVDVLMDNSMPREGTSYSRRARTRTSSAWNPAIGSRS
jgi:Ala-tRNA(Pro) deacylase